MIVASGGGGCLKVKRVMLRSYLLKLIYKSAFSVTTQQVMSSSINAPLTWKTTLSSVILATLFILLIGWLVINGTLPVKQVMDFSDWARNFIQFWVLVAIFIGLILPVIAFFTWIRQKELRRVSGFYLLILIIQIVTEQVLSSVLFPSIVVVIGSIYTALRLVQLWQSQQLMITADQPGTLSRMIMGSLWWFLLLFWSSNLIMLLVLAWPSIL